VTVTAPAAGRQADEPRAGTRRTAIVSPAFIVALVVLLAVSLGLVLWARTRPSFDSYGWLVWGHQTIAGSLNTNAAPSWKPLPYIFTVPYALFGHYEMWLWMVTVVAISLGGSVAAGRIAYRLTARGASNRWAPLVAGLFAGLALLGIQDWWHYMLSAQSDTVIVALSLGAIDCHLSGHPRWAFALGVLAALGRPEVWPFLGLYSIWMWRTVPEMRWLIGGGIVVILLLWFGVPALTSRTPFVAASNAFGSGRRLRGDQVFGTIRRFLDLYATPLEVVAAASVVVAAIRRDLVTLVLAAGAALWVLVEIVFSLHGWPGLGRYMFGAGGVMVVIAAVLVGRLLSDLPGIVATGLGRPKSARAFSWVGIGLVAVIVASLLPAAVSDARSEHRDLRAQRIRTKEIDRLSGVVARYGGATRLDPCGEPLTRLEYQTLLAWTLHVNVARVGYKYGEAIAHGNPIVLFTPIPAGGWLLQAVHQRRASCLGLPQAG
jgi:hypothetical protein